MDVEPSICVPLAGYSALPLPSRGSAYHCILVLGVCVVVGVGEVYALEGQRMAFHNLLYVRCVFSLGSAGLS